MPMPDASADDWIDLHGQAMFRWAMVQVRDPEVAADLVQEALLAAVRSRDRFAGQSSDRTWLIGILRHKVLDHFRRVGRERPAADHEAFAAMAEREGDDPARSRWQMAEGDAGPEATLLRGEVETALAECIGALPERLRIVFSARELDEQSTEEICNAFAITPTNLGVMLFRARTRLRDCLTGKGIDLRENATI